MAGWQDLLDAGMQIGKQVMNFQFEKKAMRQQASLARKMARAGQGAQGLPMMGLGYAAAPQYGGNVGSGFMGFGPEPGANTSIFGNAGDTMAYPGPYALDQFGGVQGGSSSTAPGAGCFKVTMPGQGRVSPCREISAVGPDGKQYSWIYRGRPVLYSGDLAHCKRVGKILRRAGRKAGSRFR